MSTELMRPEPGEHALTVVEPGRGPHPAARPAPPEDASPDDAPPAATTWGPHDRVPQADAEAEC
ncbi:MAG TPA: hypothetical protein VFJ16_23455 [Longimicrobium sp.]|nr:hypothetical protein [Longimicrobium sp.]